MPHLKTSKSECLPCPIWRDRRLSLSKWPFCWAFQLLFSELDTMCWNHFWSLYSFLVTWQEKNTFTRGPQQYARNLIPRDGFLRADQDRAKNCYLGSSSKSHRDISISCIYSQSSKYTWKTLSNGGNTFCCISPL